MTDDHEGLDDDFDLDDELLLAAVEQAERQAKMGAIVVDSDDEFEDLDIDDLIIATENAEKQHATIRTSSGSNLIKQQSLSSFFTSRSSTTSPGQQLLHPQQHQHAESSSASAPMAASVTSILTGGSDHATEVPPTPPPPLSPDTPCAHKFDPVALTTWIYPTNYPVRLYQWNIVKKALFDNTLVALPTGLGKTFIAAVVMYNYWRWFPKGKVVFMAPTKPLVTQQVEACFNICGIPQSEMIEITGHVDRNKRKQFWESHRVFFMTPQTMQNDLESRTCPAHLLTCVVVDEAHKATGSYAYGEVIKLISKEQNQYRVLALTATPGTNLQAVQTVVSKLHITQIQIRTEDSMDIQEHAFGKKVQHILVGLEYTAGATGSVPEYLNRFREGFFKPVLERLSRFQAILSTEVDRNSNYNLLQAQKHFSANCRNFNNAVKSMVAVDFSIAMAMARCYERLCFHGVGPFLDHLEEFLNDLRATVESGKRLPKEKNSLLNNAGLKRFLEDINRLRNQPGFIGHPKIEKMVNIVLQHLSDHGQDTRVMIFSTYRSSVDEIVRVLSEHEPMVRCSFFVGQAGRKDGRKGLNQREQQEIVSKFKRGDLNVLVATSIGEEGLDIGEVDLIICYDSQSSPIRMLQRMGRTGRKRRGRCVMIMTEQEERKFKNAKASYAQVQNAIARGGTIELFKPNPSVLPENYRPVWCKKHLTIGTFFKPVTGKRKRQSKPVDTNGHLIEAVEQEFLMNLNVGSIDEAFGNYWPTTVTTSNMLLKANRYLPRNAELTPANRVSHSSRTKRFVELVSSMEQQILDAIVAGPEDRGSESEEHGQAILGSQLIIPTFDRGGTKWLGDQLILPSPIRKTNTSSVAEISSSPKCIEQMSLDSDLHLSNGSRVLTDNTDDNDVSASTDPLVHEMPTTALDIGIDIDLPESVDLDMFDDQPLLPTSTPPHQGLKRLASPAADTSASQKPRHDDRSMTFLEFDFDSQPLGSQPQAVDLNRGILEDKVQVEFDFSTQMPVSPGAISHNTTSTDFERILPPELSTTVPIGDGEDEENEPKYEPLPLSAVRQPTQQMGMDKASISPAMLQWLTSRPVFSKAAKGLLQERMDIVKIRSWIDDGDQNHPEEQQTRPAKVSDQSAPSFDDFDIDESVLASLENIPRKQLETASYLNATFNQVLENKVDEDTSIVYTSIPQEDFRSLSPPVMVAQSPDHVRNNYSKLVSPTATSARTASPLTSSSPLRPPLTSRNVSDFSSVIPAASPVHLRQMSRSGMTTPLREDRISAASLSPSPIVFRRRKRRTITIDEDDNSREERYSVAHMNDQGSDGSNNNIYRSIRHRLRDNMFLDLEAELSSGDENGHRNMNGQYDDNAEDDDGGSDLSRYEASFIDDGSSGVMLHDDGDEVDQQAIIYRTSLMSQQVNDGGGPVFSEGPPRRKTWLDRFEADKWLTPQEDDEVVDDSYSEIEESSIAEGVSDDFV